MTEPYDWDDKDIDRVSAKGLYLFIENDGDLYRRQYTPIIKNLVAKKARGVYDHGKAAKLFGYLVESGAKRYETGRDEKHIPDYFTKAVRDSVARELRDQFETEYGLGNYREMVPKKYQVVKKAATRRSARKSTPVSLKGVR